jgi:hypothetical protein
MASKQDSLLVTLGKRMLGFGRSSTGCCAAPAATDRQTSEATRVDASEAEPKMPQSAREAACCAPSTSARATTP